MRRYLSPRWMRLIGVVIFAASLAACDLPGSVRGICSLPADMNVQLRPAVVDGVIYVGGQFGNIYALRASDGKLLWITPLSTGLLSTPAVVAGVVYVRSATTLYALAATDGRIIWHTTTFQPGFAVALAMPVIGAGLVYVAGGSGVVAVHARDGTPAWSFALPVVEGPNPPEIVGDLTLVNDTLYFGADGLYALAAATGKQRWFTPSSSPLIQFTTPVLVQGVLYDSIIDSTVAGPRSLPSAEVTDVAAYNPANRRRLLLRQFAGGPTTRPILAQGLLVVATQTYTADAHFAAQLVALTSQTGTVAWTLTQNDNMPLLPNTDMPLVYAQNTLYLGGTDISAVDATSHTVRWRGAAAQRPMLPVAVVGNTLYGGVGGSGNYTCNGPHIPPTDGGVVALHAADGQALWQTTLSAGQAH